MDATNFAACWTEARWEWAVCLRLLLDSVAIWTRALVGNWCWKSMVVPPGEWNCMFIRHWSKCWHLGNAAITTAAGALIGHCVRNAWYEGWHNEICMSILVVISVKLHLFKKINIKFVVIRLVSYSLFIYSTCRPRPKLTALTTNWYVWRININLNILL